MTSSSPTVAVVVFNSARDLGDSSLSTVSNHSDASDLKLPVIFVACNLPCQRAYAIYDAIIYSKRLRPLWSNNELSAEKAHFIRCPCDESSTVQDHCHCFPVSVCTLQHGLQWIIRV